MGKCEEFEEALSALVDGELGDDRRGEVQAHLDSCDACKRTVERWQRLGSAARALDVPGDAAWE